MFILIMKLFIIIINMVFGVGFYMLMERKILGYVQYRKGPNKMMYLGYMQFLLDSMKLMLKEWLDILFINYIIYYFMVLVMMLMSLIMWLLIPYMIMMVMMNFSFLMLMLILSLKILMVIMMVWSMNNNYAMLSMLRMLVQILTYEVSLLLIFFLIILLLNNFNLMFMYIYQLLIWNFCMNFWLSYIWLMSMMVELTRVPFDFYEGESELISGFNIEYNSLYFMYLFLIEYLDMMFMSFLTFVIFFSSNLFDINYYLIMMMIMYMILWIRSFMIRYRYDKMMLLMWKYIMPYLLVFILYMNLLMLL